jgi:hypothetical protein
MERKGVQNQVLQLAAEAMSKDDIERKIVIWGKKLLYVTKGCADQVLQLAAEAMSKDYRNLCPGSDYRPASDNFCKGICSGQVLVADFALQTSVIPPSPLRISMVVTSDVFMLSKLLQYAIERGLTANVVKW